MTGADRARKLARIQGLERTCRISALDRHQLDAANLTAAELMATCRQQPAESPLRLVVVDQAHRLEATAVNALVTLADVIGRNAWVVLLVETNLSVRHPLAHAGKGITVEDFPARDVAAAKPFALTEALGRRDAASALLAVREQLLAGKDPIEVLGLIVWQVQRWVLVKRLLIGGASLSQVVSETGFKLWQVQRLSHEVAGLDLPKLQQLLEYCWQTDRQLRLSRAVPELALEMLVMALCVSPNTELPALVTA